MEIWKFVTATNGKYEVSDHGRVRNAATLCVLKPMLTGSRRHRRPKVRVSTNPRVDLCVAALVLETFVSQRPVGCVAMHIDDNPQNNAASNLRWGTTSENAVDMARKGRGGFQKLGPVAVADIRRRRAAGECGAHLAVEYGVSSQRICDIYKGRTAL
jgi:hypothetical protein